MEFLRQCGGGTPDGGKKKGARRPRRDSLARAQTMGKAGRRQGGNRPLTPHATACREGWGRASKQCIGRGDGYFLLLKKGIWLAIAGWPSKAPSAPLGRGRVDMEAQTGAPSLVDRTETARSCRHHADCATKYTDADHSKTIAPDGIVYLDGLLSCNVLDVSDFGITASITSRDSFRPETISTA